MRNKKIYYRDADVAKVLKISRRTLSRLIKDRKLPGAIIVTGDLRIWDADIIQKHLDSKLVEYELSNSIS
jgi:hypothetical protein